MFKKVSGSLISTGRNSLIGYFGFGLIFVPEVFNPFLSEHDCNECKKYENINQRSKWFWISNPWIRVKLYTIPYKTKNISSAIFLIYKFLKFIKPPPSNGKLYWIREK